MWECLIVLCHSRQLKVQINSLKNSGGDTLNYCLVWPGAGRSKGLFRFSKFGLKLFFSHKRETLSSTKAPVWYSFLPFCWLSTKKKQRSLQRREEEKQNFLGAWSNNEIIWGLTLFRLNFNPFTLFWVPHHGSE